MAIFRREAEAEDPDPQTAQRPTAGARPAARPTHIAPGSEVVGEITGATDVRVDGHLQGEVRIDGAVVVGPDGRVQGKLEAGTVEVGGRVKGDVRGKERITLTSTAELHGDLVAPRVTIQEGAYFKGQVEMGRQDATGPSARPSDHSEHSKKTKQGGER